MWLGSSGIFKSVVLLHLRRVLEVRQRSQIQVEAEFGLKCLINRVWRRFSPRTFSTRNLISLSLQIHKNQSNLEAEILDKITKTIFMFLVLYVEQQYLLNQSSVISVEMEISKFVVCVFSSWIRLWLTGFVFKLCLCALLCLLLKVR